ncbi:MAG: hypothetical protein L0196_01660 [candidate division Zixibacteria bacterium]|nr:hypothetical protein [candidate division Zixibacteria bacterium]
MDEWHERKEAIREELEGLISCKQAELDFLHAISEKLDGIKSSEEFENFVEGHISQNFDSFVRDELQSIVDNLGYSGLTELSGREE